MGKFLLGMVSGGLVVTGGLVLGQLLFPASPANDNAPAAPVEEPVAAPAATTPDAGAAVEAKADDPAAAPAEDAPVVAEAAPDAPAGDGAAAAPVPEAPAEEVAKPQATEAPAQPGATGPDAAATAESVAPLETAEAGTEVVLAEADPAAPTTAAADTTAEASAAAEKTATATVPTAEPAPAETAAEPVPEPAEAPAPAEPAPEAATASEAAPAAVAPAEPASTEAEAATANAASGEAAAPAATDSTTDTVTAPTEAAPTEAAPTPVAPAEPVPEPAAPATELAEATPAPAPADEPAATPDPAPAATDPVAEAPAAQAPATETPTAEPAVELLPAAPEAAPAPESTGDAPADPAVDPAVEPATEAPVEIMPVPEGDVTPGTVVTEMPGTKPAALPGVAAPTAETETAEAGEKSSTFKPAPGLIKAGEGVIIGRDKAGEAASADPATAPVDPRPIAQFATPFENPEAKPPFAIVLVDPGTPDLDRAGLAALPFPVSVALDPLDPATPDRAAAYRAAGKEVVMLVTGIAQGAQAADVEVAFQAMEQGLPEAVAAMDLAQPTFQNNRGLASAVVPILKADGRGLLTWDEGLNAADQVARREDLEAAVVFRNLDQAGGDKVAVRRLLDRAVFKADQAGRVSVVGTATPETVAALLEWTVEGKAATVALAPLTAVLKVD